MVDVTPIEFTSLTLIVETRHGVMTHEIPKAKDVIVETENLFLDRLSRNRILFTPIPNEDGEIVKSYPGRPEPHDEYHTMSELYYYRMLYNAHAAIGWMASGLKVVKSKKHHDGEACFDGQYFIVVVQLPTGQVSNHYKLEHWDLFNVPAVDLAPEWDGHTPEIAANRLYNYLTMESYK